MRVSFTDNDGFSESVTSLPFGPVAEAPSRTPSTLVGNTGQAASATAAITEQYAMEFRLGAHGQGYEISSVSIELAAVPSDLAVSLWNGGAPGGSSAGVAAYKLFDFENPGSFAVGLNEFTAPAVRVVNHFIVLSGFGSSLSIKETTSDDEDEGGEPGAILFDNARVRALSSTGRWGTYTSRASVLRLAVEGSQRDSGILASNYAQDVDDPVDQDIVSIGDEIGFGIALGAADRYLIRGLSFSADDTTSISGPFHNPFTLRSDSLTGTEQFSLINTRDVAGIPVWTAPQGATVEGGCTTTQVGTEEVVTCNDYVFEWNISPQRLGATLARTFQVIADDDGEADTPTAPGVTLAIGEAYGDYGGNTPLMAVLGEPLHAMVQNLGQTDNSYVSLGGASAKVLSQGFTTGSDEFGYRLQGIGVNIEGSSSFFPDDSASVSVAVHADSSGQPGAKLFDLVSPAEYGAGHSFFEAPPGTYLDPSTSYVLVWRYLDGTVHRLQQTTSDSEDSGARTDASTANTFYRGADLGSLFEDSGGNALEFAVYGEVLEEVPFVPFVRGGIPVPLSWLHIPEDVEVGYQLRALFVTHRGRLPTSGDIGEYNSWVQWEAEQAYIDPVIRSVASEFKAVACTAAVDARTNTNMPAYRNGVPIHWLDGGWQDRPTLIANDYAEFYGDEWVNSDWGAYVTGNSAYFHPSAKVWTGCDASGDPHPSVPMGATMDMVAVGTPRDPADNNAPLGAVDVAIGYAYYKYVVVIDGEEQERLLPLFAISPIFTVVAGTEGD